MPLDRRQVPRILAAVAGSTVGLFAFASASGGAAGPAVPVSAWPMALHDPLHTATASATGPTTGHLAWTRNLGANVTPGPVIGADGTIYVATNAGVLHALDPSTGADKWTFDGGGPSGASGDLSISPLVLASGDVLWPGSAATLFLLSSQGQLLWKHQFGGAVTSPTVAGTAVYVQTVTGDLAKLDVSGATPTLRWTTSLGAVSFASPVIAPNGEVVTTVDDRLVVVADRGGRPSVVWTRRFHGAVEVSAAVGADGTIVVGTNDPFEYAFTSTGAFKWKVRRNTQSYSSPSVSPDGLSYFGGNSGHLQVVRTSSGRPVVTDHGLQGLWGAQVVDARGDVYFGTIGSHVYGYTATGRLLFDVPVAGAVDSYPAMTASGTLVLGDEDGNVYAFAG